MGQAPRPLCASVSTAGKCEWHHLPGRAVRGDDEESSLNHKEEDKEKGGGGQPEAPTPARPSDLSLGLAPFGLSSAFSSRPQIQSLSLRRTTALQTLEAGF